jgi:hypothetical protein
MKKTRKETAFFQKAFEGDSWKEDLALSVILGLALFSILVPPPGSPQP